MGAPLAAADAGQRLLALYDRSLPEVYGYLVRRTPSAQIAEDLTSETFMAAVTSIRSGAVHEVTTAWLIGIARHKLVDHWRREAREARRLEAVASEPDRDDDPWDDVIDAARARSTLASLGAHHRAALVLRYADGLPVPQVAAELGRTIHATEALLVRARRAFRVAYEAGGPDDE